MNRLQHMVLASSILTSLSSGAALTSSSNVVPFVACEGSKIQCSALPKPPDGKRISWLVHRGGWGDSPAYGTRLGLQQYDEFLHDYSSGLAAEFSALSALGDAAFIQDFGDVRKLAAASKVGGVDYAVMNTLAPLALSQLKIKTPQDCADYLVKQLSTRKEFPGYYSIDGKPVVFIFNVAGFKTKEWTEILRKTRAAYPGEELQFVAQRSVWDVLNMPDSQAYMKDILEVFDGIMFWGGPQDAKLKNLDIARQAIRTLGKKKLVFWVLTNGYWRPEKGIFMDPRGTGVWRDQLEICFQNEFDGLIIESWNDLEENTEVVPSRENGGVFFEILKYYAAISNQREYAAEYPGLLLTQPREVLLGDLLNVEVVFLPVKMPRKEVQLQIENERGQVIYRSADQMVPATAAGVLKFSLPTHSLSESGRLIYKVLADGRTIDAGTWTVIRKSKINSPWMRGVVLSKMIPAANISFSVQPVQGGPLADIKIKNAVPLSRVDVYRNDKPVWSLDAERLNRARQWQYGPVCIELDFQMPKNYADENSNHSATLSVTHGSLVRGFDKLGRGVVNTSENAEWDAPPSQGRQFNVKLLADADANTCFTVNLTSLKQTITFTLGELRKQNRLEKMTSAHGRVWIQEISHPVIWQYEAGVLGSAVNEKIQLNPAGDRFENEYYLLVVDKAGKTFRSQPVTLYSEPRNGGGKQWFWNEVSGTRFSAPAARKEQLEMKWSFDGPASRLYDDERNSGVLARLGGGMYRAGNFNPEAIPAVIKRDNGCALQFDGNDYVQIDSGAFPQGAFEMKVSICPEKSASARQTLFFCDSNLTLFLTPDEQVGVAIKGTDDSKQSLELINPKKLPPGKWTDISVRYDYQQVILRVEGQEAVLPLANGSIRRISSECYLGAEVTGAESTKATQFFTGKLDDLNIRCGALVGE